MCVQEREDKRETKRENKREIRERAKGRRTKRERDKKESSAYLDIRDRGHFPKQLISEIDACIPFLNALLLQK